IESVSEFKFLFNRKDVDVTRKVSINVTRKPIKYILEQMFAGTDVVYEVLGKQIVLRRDLKKSFPPTNTTSSETTAQQFTVSGTVTDTQGVPLSGANIVEKGTTNGVTADFDGNYSLEVADGNAVL